MDVPAIEYHPFGTITLNFDDRPIKLRRCRVGDLQYAKDLLEEIQTQVIPKQQVLLDELRAVDAADADDEATTKAKNVKSRELLNALTNIRYDLVHSFVSMLVVRMGDAAPPVKEDWPIEMLDLTVPALLVEHWQTRPLASGRPLSPPTTNLNGQSSSEPQPLPADSPAAPLPR